MKFRKLLALALALGLVLAACGDDDDTSTDGGTGQDDVSDTDGGDSDGGDSGGDVSSYAAVFADFLRDDTEDFAVTDDEAECAGEAIAEVIGEERLTNEGDPEAVRTALEEASDLGTFALSADEGVEIGEGILDCIPSVTEQIAAQMAAGDEATEACVADALTDDLVAKVFGAALAGTEMGEDLEAEFQNALAECAPS